MTRIIAFFLLRKKKVFAILLFMNITEIFLKDFRNFSELKLNLSDEVNIFLGRNAQGKTNILESVQFTSQLRSRAAKLGELIKLGQVESFVKVNFLRADVSQELAVELSAEKKSRRFFVNGNATRSKSFIGRLNTVMFSPEDLFMFKGAPAVRRQFLDNEISQASPAYFENLSSYNRLVTQRNNLLKKIREGTARKSNLAMWNEPLAEFAAAITTKRLISIDNLNTVANAIHRNISAQTENLIVKYEISGLDFDIEKNFYDATFKQKLFYWYGKNIVARTNADIERGTTTFGPHHDDLKFFIDDRELKLFGSQGQFRTTALSLKLSELEILKKAADEYPVLLLDDVMSELDAERREQLLKFLTQKKIQTLITATESKYFPSQNFGKIYTVNAGIVREI